MRGRRGRERVGDGGAELLPVACTVAACLVTGASSGGWSSSCSAPGAPAVVGRAAAEHHQGRAVEVRGGDAAEQLVTPGPAVTTASPGVRVSFAVPSAANTAVCSWRTSTRRSTGPPAADPRLAADGGVVEREHVGSREGEHRVDAVRRGGGDRVRAARGRSGWGLSSMADNVPAGNAVLRRDRQATEHVEVDHLGRHGEAEPLVDAVARRVGRVGVEHDEAGDLVRVRCDHGG